MKKINFLFPIIIGLLGFLTLVYLGIWQVNRLEWKLDKIENIEKKINALSVNIPNNPTKLKHQYLSVKLEGRILDRELHVLTSTKKDGPGFKVISPFLTANDEIILVDLGFIPEIEKNSFRKKGFTILEGNLLWPNEVDYFTPMPNYKENIWFARDLNKMSKELGAKELLVIASKLSLKNNIIYMPINTNLTNNHLQYAITWFSLSIVWIGMTIFWIIKLLRSNKREIK